MNDGMEELSEETKFINELISKSKALCLTHTRKYDYFIENNKN